MITITGPNSFIGKNFINFLNKKKLKILFNKKKNINIKIKPTIIVFKRQKKTNILIHISSSSLALLYRKKIHKKMSYSVLKMK